MASFHFFQCSSPRLKKSRTKQVGNNETGEMNVSVAQSCLTVCNPMDCSLPGSSVHGILQARSRSHSLLQGIFPTQGSDTGFLLCKEILYHCATRVLPVEGFEGLGFILLCPRFPLSLYFFLFLLLVLLKQFFFQFIWSAVILKKINSFSCSKYCSWFLSN